MESDVEWVRRHEDFARVLVREALAGDPRFQPDLVAAAAPFVERVAEILATGVERGEIRADDEDLSARENLRYFASVLLASPRRIAEALATVQLHDSAERVVHTLSGGEQARVSLATALVSQPRVLILDEPTVGLDPVLRRRRPRRHRHGPRAGGDDASAPYAVTTSGERAWHPAD